MSEERPVDQYRRIKAECDAAGKPCPWEMVFEVVISGDCRMDGLSRYPIARSKCPKCGYRLTTNEPPQAWTCPTDGELLESVPYP